MRLHGAIVGTVLLMGCQGQLCSDHDDQRPASIAEWPAPRPIDLSCVYLGEQLDTGGLVRGVELRRASDGAVLAAFVPVDLGSVPFLHHHPDHPWSPDGAWLVLQDGACDGFVVAPAATDPHSVETRIGALKVQVVDNAGTRVAPFHEFLRWTSGDRFEFQVSLSDNRWIAECNLQTRRIRVQSAPGIDSQFESGPGCEFVVQVVGEGELRENFQPSQRPRSRRKTPM